VKLEVIWNFWGLNQEILVDFSCLKEFDRFVRRIGGLISLFGTQVGWL